MKITRWRSLYSAFYPLLGYFEKECDAELFHDRKAYAERNRKRIRFAERELIEEYTDQICVNF